MVCLVQTPHARQGIADSIFLLGRRHPNLHFFLEALLKEEEYFESKRAIDLCQDPPRKKRKYIRNDVGIERVV